MMQTNIHIPDTNNSPPPQPLSLSHTDEHWYRCVVTGGDVFLLICTDNCLRITLACWHTYTKIFPNTSAIHSGESIPSM